MVRKAPSVRPALQVRRVLPVPPVRPAHRVRKALWVLLDRKVL